MTEIAAGWYPGPAGAGGHRWWDGTSWTATTTPDQAGAPVYAGAAGTSNAGFAPADRGFDQHGYQPHAPAMDYGAYQQAYHVPNAVEPARLLRGNRYTAITCALAVLYSLLALGTHTVLLGIAPALYAVQAFRRHERLAPLAALAAVVAVLLHLVPLG